MTKRKKRVLLFGSLGLLALASVIVIPTAVVLSQKHENKITNQIINNGLINLNYSNNTNYTTSTKNHVYTQNIFINSEIPTLNLTATINANNEATISYAWYAGTITVNSDGKNTYDPTTSVNLNVDTPSFTPDIKATTTGTYNYFCVITAKFANGQTLTTVSNQYTINVFSTIDATFYANSGTNNTYTFYKLTNSNYTLSIYDILFKVGSASFTSANTPLLYQWYATSSATPITNADGLTTSMEINNATHSSYTIPSASSTTMYYYCKVSGYWNGTSFSVISPQYTVSFIDSDSTIYISSNSQLNSINVLQNETTYQTLTLNDTGLPTTNATVSYQWYKNNVAIQDATKNTYTLASSDVSSTGSNSYYVEITITNNTSKMTATYTSSNFIVNVVSTSINKVSINTIGQNPTIILNASSSWIYLVTQSGQNSVLPTFVLTPNLTNTDVTGITYTYTWYFVNLADPNLSNKITTSSNVLMPPTDWIKTYGLTAGTTYSLFGTVSGTLNGASVTTTGSNTITINNTKLTLPANTQISSTQFTISIASTSAPTISVNNNASTTSSSPALATLNSSGTGSITLTSTLTFNDLSSIRGSSSGSSSTLTNPYGGDGTLYNTFSVNTLSNVTGNSYTTTNLTTPQVMDYITSKQSNGLLTLTFTNSVTLNIDIDTLPNLTFNANVQFGSTDSNTYSATGYGEVEYATSAQAEQNVQYLLSNSSYSINFLNNYFTQWATNHESNFDDDLFSWLSNKTTSNTQVATYSNSGYSWTSLDSLLPESVKKAGLTGNGWGISLSNDFPGYITYNSVTNVSSSYTNNWMTTAVGFNTVALNVGLNFDQAQVGNDASNPTGGSAYRWGTAQNYFYLASKMNLSVIWPYNIQTPSSISISSSGLVTLNWAKPNTTNAAFAMYGTHAPFGLYNWTSQSTVLSASYYGLSFNFTNSFSYSITSSLLPTYKIA